MAAAAALWLAGRVAADSLGGTELAPPPIVVRVAGALVVLPWALATLVRAWRPRIALEEVPAAVTAWRLPLPGPGFAVHLRSGKALGVLGPGDPSLLGASESDPRARLAAAWRPPGRWRLALRFGVFPLVPAVILFRLHQIIEFGGPLGLYRARGLARYLEAFAVQWMVVAAHLVLWAAVVGVVAGAATLLAARATSTFAAARRAGRAVRLAGDVLYGAGPLGLMALAFLR